MASKIETKVTLEFLNQTNIADEDLFRQLACKLVNGMPFNELSFIFRFGKLQPETKEFDLLLNDWNTTDYHRQTMIKLRNEGMALFEAEFRPPEKLPQIKHY
jgi:hypothetical protein